MKLQKLRWAEKRVGLRFSKLVQDRDAVRFENLHPRILGLSTRESESPKLSRILGCSFR